MRMSKRKNPPHTRAVAWNSLLVVLSLAAGLAVCEAALRLADTRYEQAAEPPLRNYHWPNMSPHPDTRTEHTVLYNRFGNRQHRDFSKRDMETGVHIAFFGDSFTENPYVPVQYTFAEVLDHMLNAQARKAPNEPREGRAVAPAPHAAVHVHNFGARGTGPDSQYLRYRGFAHKERLRHVFYVHCRNDFADLQRSGVYALNATGDLVRRMRRPSADWLRLLSGLRLTYLALDVWQRLAGTDDGAVRSPRQDPHDERDLVFEALLSRWRDEAETSGSAFHIVLLPQPGTAGQYHRRVRPGLFHIFDLRDCFEDEIPGYVWEDWRFRSDGHWNEAGQMVAAHCLYRFLEGRLGLQRASHEELALVRYAYYRAFADDAGWQGHRFTPSPPWASPAPADTAEAARIRSKHLALERDGEDRRRHVVREVRQGRPLAPGTGWGVYASPRHRVVVYVKSPCDETDLPPQRLFVRAVPAGMGDERGPFPNVALAVPPAFWRAGDECVVVQSLPLWRALVKIRTGEYLGPPGGSVLWEVEFPFDSTEQVAATTAAYRQEYDAFANDPPKARSLWNIHVLDGRVALLKAPCDAGDLRGDFFLRMYPTDPRDAFAPNERRPFHRRVFQRFGSRAVLAAHQGGKCLFWTTLPKWPVATISAGQKDEEALLWETTFHLN